MTMSASTDATCELRLESFPVLHNNILLRQLSEKDVGDIHRLLCAPGVYEGLVSIPRSPDRAFAQARTEKMLESMADGTGFQLMAEFEGEVIGTIGIGINWRHRHGGLGYHLDEPARGRGFASSMLRGILDHGFDAIGLHRIWAESWIDNHASIRLLERNGFMYEGIRRQAYLKEDQYLDTQMWAMTATDPRPWKEKI